MSWLGGMMGKLAKGLAVWTVGAVAVLAVLGAIGYQAFTWKAPSEDRLWEVNRVASVVMLDREGEKLANRGAFYGERLRLGEVPDYLPQAFLAIEDRRFYEHFGLDWRGLARAMWANLQAGAFVQGGSTISQQTAKNLFLSNERTVARKLEELGLALWLERHLSKQEILELYLNRIYLGAGTYGIDAAAQFYFGKSAREVTLPEAAMLAGLPKAPSRFAPTSDLRLAQSRADTVLKAMVEAGFVSEEAAYAARLDPAEPIQRTRLEGLQYFVDHVLAEVERLLGDAPADAPANLVVHTTLDGDLQREAETAVQRRLETADGPRAEQAALVSLSRDGAVRAMVGGRSYGESQFNRAVQAKRQPGSAFKPFVYVAALEAGIEPDDVRYDEPVEIGTYRPRNYGGLYSGAVTLREAMEKSINTIAVTLGEELGQDKVADVARRFGLGIGSELETYKSLPLGTAEVSLLDLTDAYLPFARDGLGADAYAVTRIETEGGEVLWTRPPPEPRQVIGRDIAYDMTNMMYGVVHGGTGKAAQFGEWQAAGKTGTSSDWKDAWFLGYTAELVTGVWVGRDDASSMDRISGGGLPAVIWKDYMAAAHAGRELAALPGANLVRHPEGAAALGNFFGRLEDRFARLAAEADDPRGRRGDRAGERTGERTGERGDGEKSLFDWFDWQ